MIDYLDPEREMERWRGRVEAKLVRMCDEVRRLDKHCEECDPRIEKKLDAIHERITGVERKVAFLSGAGAGIGAIAGTLLGFFLSHVFGGN